MFLRGSESRLMRSPLIINNGGNAITPQNKVVITLTADNVNAADVSTVNIFSGAGDAALSALPAGVTVSGDYDNWDNFQDYFRRVKTKIVGIQLKTSDTDNFGYRMELYDTNPNQQNQKKAFIDLTNYRVPTGNGYADSLNINDVAFYVLAQTILNMQLKKNTNTRVTLTVAEWDQSAQTSPGNF